MKKALSFFALATCAATVWATPYNTPTLDGRPIEYDDYDYKDTYHGAPAWGAAGTLTNLYVTWDATYLYIALQGWHPGNKLVVLLDVDPGAGTGATTTTNWSGIEPSVIKYNDYGWVGGGGFGLDYLLACVEIYNNILRIDYDGEAAPSTNNVAVLFDNGNGSSPLGTPVDMANYDDTTLCPHKGFEARIPWTNLYQGTRFGTVEQGETVPRGAAIRLLAGIHDNNPTNVLSSPDTIPNQSVEDYTNGIVTTLDYMSVTVDGDTNGLPDNFGSEGNAPYLRAAVGALGGSYVMVGFNEPVTAATAENTANWTVGGVAPVSAARQGSQVVLLGLAAPIATNFVPIRAAGIEDSLGFHRTTDFCLFPAESGIPQDVTVTFQVNTNSGMGNPAVGTHDRPTAFFLNGSSLPLEWGYPPYDTVALTAIPGSNNWASATVVFPAGSPADLWYKYSARIYGTNNYEAIRLTDFASATRRLVLNTNGSPMTVVDYLGAAAHPLRDPNDTNTPSAQNRLFKDARRGDAGVRTNRNILFQLDLTQRRRDNLARVMVMGSDPLRGFNDTGETGGNPAQDFPGASFYVAWTNAGIQLVDDGTLGDATAGDGIYSRRWGFTPDGYDAALEPGSPYSLVGGNEGSIIPYVPGTGPYQGDIWWLTRRSPRSMIYKFYAVTVSGTQTNWYESPSSNLEYYILDPAETAQIVLDPFVWNDPYLPLPPPSNAPTVTAISLTGTTAYVQFENLPSEAAHGVLVSTDLMAGVTGFQDYGLRAAGGITNDGYRQWSAAVGQITPNREFYAPYAGLEPDAEPTYWLPNYLPATLTTGRVHFCQFKTDLKGGRQLNLVGSFTGWADNPIWMTFLGAGWWRADAELSAATSGTYTEYKFRNGDAWMGGANLSVLRGGNATWTPDVPVPGAPLAIQFDVSGTGLATATNVEIHLGFDGWTAVTDPALTNLGGTTWGYSFTVPTNYSREVDFVFRGHLDGSTNLTWFSHGKDWILYMSTFVEP